MIDFLFGMAAGVFLTLGVSGLVIGLAGIWVRRALGRML